MAYNNTYNTPLINHTTYEQALDLWEKPQTGCRARIETCRALQYEFDPDQLGISKRVNKACFNATATCAALFSLNAESNVRSGPRQYPDKDD